jgi:hypothetical protein
MGVVRMSDVEKRVTGGPQCGPWEDLYRNTDGYPVRSTKVS